MVKIFIDFDDVIFNTDRFKDGRIAIFKKHGIDKKTVLKTYGELKAAGERYTISKHIRAVARKKRIASESGLDASFKRFMCNLTHYVFPDAHAFLGHYQKESLYLLSFGDRVFQSQKIEKSGVKKYFKRIIITQGDKGSEIRAIRAAGKLTNKDIIVFIDNSDEHIQEVHSIKDVITIQLLRRQGKVLQKSTYADYYAATLCDATKIISAL